MASRECPRCPGRTRARRRPRPAHLAVLVRIGFNKKAFEPAVAAIKEKYYELFRGKGGEHKEGSSGAAGAASSSAAGAAGAASSSDAADVAIVNI
mmetsp:Transcript_27730/g.88936  ORF Transcript_27730/g.88936 Transcript_27730/m.88936 type:complete len:95 (+) Transcript_27730:409-693(+)